MFLGELFILRGCLLTNKPNNDMTKTFLNYPDWQNTADTVHLMLQMAGKVKVARCDKRPEWAHVRQYLTTDGITTGLIPGDEHPFEIVFNFRQHQVEFKNSEGVNTAIPLQNGVTIAMFYERFMKALELIGSPTPINTFPQEFYDPVEFDKDEIHHWYDEQAVMSWMQAMQFAYGALMKFLAPFRGKTDMPAFYFGTMDLSGTLYSGESAPFGKDTRITRHAYDERFFEVGFWPGDIRMPLASFYVMPYPFISDTGEYEKLLQPYKARFVPEKKEFFLTLGDALSYSDPVATVTGFFNSAFDIVQGLHKWENIDWITKPLTYKEE